ncbi:MULTISPECIES: phage tail tube protein [unclassified Sphingobacterium]|uniref:phage tail tube protein n=1 Tax=unclassified Sphingobacterium TaxID=2609468 RepID=UPI0020C2D0C6|nr:MULTISPECIES: phage tail tube protein [unclassified Sphingobacterium]
MALRMQNGKEYLLFVKRAADETWKTIACLSSNGVSRGADAITSSTKCSDGFQESKSGEKNWSFSGEGNAVDDTLQASEVSLNDLKDMWASGEDAEWKMAKVGSTEVDYGFGWISQLDSTAGNNEAYTFSLTVQGTGVLATTEPVTP